MGFKEAIGGMIERLTDRFLRVHSFGWPIIADYEKNCARCWIKKNKVPNHKHVFTKKRLESTASIKTQNRFSILDVLC
jgi:hypothetical protein